MDLSEQQADRDSSGVKPADLRRKYEITYKPRGLAIIISNKTFERTGADDGTKAHTLPKRTSGDADEKALKEVLTELGFKVLHRKNKTAEEMVSIMQKKAEEGDIHKQSDVFVCAILSHGKDGAVYGTDGETVDIDDLIAPFKGDKCADLVGKPKLFFIQADKTDKGKDVANTTDSTQLDSPTGSRIIPTEADFLIAHSTVPGNDANTKGTLFIQALCDVLKTLYSKLDLLKILTRANGIVAEKMGDTNKQMPLIASALTRNLYFEDQI